MGSIQRLNLALLVYAKHGGLLRWLQMRSHYVDELLRLRGRPERRGEELRHVPSHHQRAGNNSAEVLNAYQYQPNLERRYAQLKVQQVVAQVYLNDPASIVGLLFYHFFARLPDTTAEGPRRRPGPGAYGVLVAASSKSVVSDGTLHHDRWGNEEGRLSPAAEGGSKERC